MDTIKVCLIEDDPIMGESLVDRFALEGFMTDWITTAGQAYTSILQKEYSAIVCDVRLPDFDGDELFERMVNEKIKLPPFILMSAFATVERAVSLIKNGATDYVTKPFDVSQLVDIVRTQAEKHNNILDTSSSKSLGISSHARQLAAAIPRIAGRASSILITGESGVGKEVLARLIHQYTNVSNFIPVNCGAISSQLVEAEFFGFERGAFTGADKQKKGYFEQANGGTLLLDEVGELSLAMQTALLRALQEKKIRRIGAEKDIDVNFNLICATNRNLEQMIKEKLFREDLYYRINVVKLDVKPLRERREDILWFASKFLESISQKLNEPCKKLHPLAEDILLNYDWPGNLRELHNRMESACLTSMGAVLMPSDFNFGNSSYPDHTLQFYGGLSDYREACERIYIAETLARNDGKMTESAMSLKISRKNLWEKIKRYNIDNDSARDT